MSLALGPALLGLLIGCGGGAKTSGSSDKTPPSVVSIYSTAYDKIRVEFSEKVDPTTASDPANYTIAGLAVASVSIDADGKVIRLTTEIQKYSTYDCTISKNIKDLKGNQMASDYAGNFQGAVEEPRVANVTAVKCNQILVEYSEDVDATAGVAGTYHVHPDQTISTVTFPYGGLSNRALIEISGEMEATSYTLEVVGDVKDTGGFSMHPYYGESSFQGDTRPKVELINSASIRTVRLRFTEDVEEISAETAGNYTIAQVGGGSLAVNTVERDAADYSIVLITVGSDQTQNASYKVTINSVQDLNLNAVATDTSGYFKGNGPPSVASASASGPSRVVVTFSEPIYDSDVAEAIDETNYTIEGLTVSGAGWPDGDQGDKTVVWLTTSTQLQDIYTVVLDAGVLRAQDDQTYIGAGANTASFQGDGIPTVSSAVAVDSNTVKVVFSEPVDMVSGQTAANYAVSSPGYGSLSITGANRNADPNTNEVLLTTSTQLYVNYTVTVTGVKDTTGNTITGGNTADFAGIGVDNTPPDIINAIANSSTAVRVYFNEAVEETSAETVGSYSVRNLARATVTVSGQPVAAETLQVSVTNSVTGLNSVTVTAADSENLAAGQFKRNGTSNSIVAYSIASALNYDPDSPVRAYVNGGAVELVSKTFGADGDIVITETLTNVAQTANVVSVTSTPSTATRSAGNYAQVDLTFGTALSSMVYELRVTGVSDTATPANTITSATAKVVVRGSDSTPPKLAGTYAPDATHILLLFNEPVDFLTSKAAANFAIEREIAYFDVTSNTGTTDTLTITYDTSLTYVITGAAEENIAQDEFDTGNTTTSATNMARVLNRATNSPVYAHAEGARVYMARRTAGSGTINNAVASGFSISALTSTAAVYANNRTINTSVRNEEFPREVILTLDPATPLSATHDYGITATGIADISETTNTGYGGTRIVLPISADNTAPPSDTEPPSVVSAQALSDGLVRLIFSETVQETSAETASNYAVSPTLAVNSAVRDDVNVNTVLVYTDLQAALTYTVTVNGVEDQAGNPASNATAVFTGMAAVSVNNGPVGNSINGIGNLENKSINAMIPFGDRLYVATLNSGSGEFLTEVYRSDTTGVYFTQVNNSGYNPPSQYNKQRQTTSFAVYDAGSGDRLWASTSDTPSEQSNVFYTDGTGTPIPTWTWDTPTATDWGNTTTRLLTYGIATPYLYVIEGSNLVYRSGADNYPVVSGSWDGGTPTAMAAFGGRLYVGCSGATGMKVFRSTGANADAPRAAADFEQVLDADGAGIIGMDGYDADDSSVDLHFPDSTNTSVVSIAAFKGYLYVGSANVNGAQVWRSRDGLTWERVLDFGSGDEFDGIGDASNSRITTLQTNGNYLYAGTKNATAGAEVWRTPDGITWEQFGSNGFGSTSYTDVYSMSSFLGLIYFGMENTTTGGAIFRASN